MMSDTITQRKSNNGSSMLRIDTRNGGLNVNSSSNSLPQPSQRNDNSSTSSDADFSRYKFGASGGIGNNRFPFPPLTPEVKSPPLTHSNHRYRSASTGRAMDPQTVLPPLRHTDSDCGISMGYNNASQSGHRMISKPIFIQEYNSGVPSTPVKHVLMEDRDDGSQANNSNFDNESGSGYHPFLQSSYTAHDQQMDEIIIQKYFAEKNKFKAAEANNAILHSHINEMSKLMESQKHEIEMQKSAVIASYEEEMKKNEALKLTVKQLQEKLGRKEDEIDQKLKAMQEDNERKLRMVRDEAEIKMIGVRNEMMGVQKKYGAAKSRLEQEIEKSDELKKGYEAMEHIFHQRNALIEEEQSKSQQLQESVNVLKREFSEQDKSTLMQISSLSKKVEDMVEKYEFEKQKAEDFSNELKIMSVQYVDNLEKLEEEEGKNEKLVKALDEVEAQLSAVTKKVAITTKDLEEMAKGFIETDDLLTREGDITSKLSLAINSLNVQLHNEKAKSKALEDEMVALKKSDKKNMEEATKFKISSKSISDELSMLKNDLSSKVSAVAELTKTLNQTKKAYEVSEEKVHETQRISKKLASEAAKYKLESTSLQNQLDEVTKQQKEEKELLEKVSLQLQEQTDELTELKAKASVDKYQSDEIIQEQERKLRTLTTSLEGMAAKCKDQEELIFELRATLKANKERIAILTDIKVELEDTLEAEREENNENFQEQVEKYNVTSKELLEIEKKNTILFNNLVETEEELRKTKEELDIARMCLETKDDEFRPIENMLRREIETRDNSLHEEQRKSIELSSQVIEMNKKCNEMHSNLVAAEEHALEMEQVSNELKNKIAGMEQNSKNLQLSLEKEQNGPHQRKLKVAKKMIQAEKTRYKALQKEIEAKDLMIKRVEDKLANVGDKLQNAIDQLEMEKEKNASHSKRALQDMHRQLEDTRKSMRIEKEKLMQKLRAEKAHVKSLSIRLKTLEKSTGHEEVSNALKEYHEVEEKARILMEENEKLKDAIDEKTKSEISNKKRLSDVSTNLQELTNYLDTMAQYCHGLEEEKRLLKKEVEAFKNNGGSISGNSLFNVLEGDESDDDDDTVSGMSLSDFSVAQIPSTSVKKTRSDIINIISRTNVLTKSTANLLGASDEGIELTVENSETP